MAIFGRNTARQRLRRAARESLKIPAFSAPVDCTPWVTGGLWPAELSTVTAETAPLVKYLKTDLQRIVNSANEELKGIRRAGLADPRREAEEARVITDARAFAVRRVESTVRHLRTMPLKVPSPLRPVNGADDAEKTPRFKLAPPRPEPEETTDAQAEVEEPTAALSAAELRLVEELESWEPTGDEAVAAEPDLDETAALSVPDIGAVEESDSWELTADEPVAAEPEPVETVALPIPEFSGLEDVDSWEPPAAAEPEPAETTSLPVPEVVDTQEPDSWQPTADETVVAEPEPVETVALPIPEFSGPEDVDSWEPPSAAEPEPAETTEFATANFQASSPFDSDDTEVLEDLSALIQEISPPQEPEPQEPEPQEPVTRPVSMFEPVDAPPVIPAPPAPSEREEDRLERLLKFVARQEPGLRWAVGNRRDGTTVLVTDLAYGWIPPGITLPAEVHLLEPARRTGAAKALLGETTLLATYAPGDPLGWASDYDVTDTSSRPRDLPPIDDLGWVLSEATRWRDGLPRIVYTMAKAGAAGTGIIDAEIDLLRVYLDTLRYQLLAQYPDIDAGLLLNCLLLAATEGMATMDQRSANYHFAWFNTLSTPPASGWKPGL